MSADKHKLHDRAMKLYALVCKRYSRIGRIGLGYCREGGVGPSKELDYLLKRKLVKIDRPKGYINRSSIIPMESQK